MTHEILSILRQAVMISGFVMVMMLIVEYITIQSKGQWTRLFDKHPSMQLLLASLLGITPGCLGGFAVVTLYTHKVINFPALAAAMIATSGDEAFLMLSMIPKQAVELQVILFVVAISSGIILSWLVRKKQPQMPMPKHKQFHEQDPQCYCFSSKQIWPQLRNISFARALLLFIGLVFMYLLFSGHEHNHGGSGHWEKIFFVLLNMAYLFIVASVPEHFLRVHLWEHTIKHHLPKIFMWTLSAFVLIHIGEQYFDTNQWVQQNMAWVLLAAVLIGIIPESGPHIIFISLFAAGTIPMSILLANSIVQDGHSSLPLLAESPRTFMWVKLVNMVVGLLVGGTMWWLGM